MVKEAVEAENIEVKVAPELFCFAQKEFKKWSSQVLKETVDFIKKNAPEDIVISSK